MSDILDLADKLWRGEVAVAQSHPFSAGGGLCEPLEGVAFVPSFANVSAVDTEAGLFLVDTGSQVLARAVHGTIRGWRSSRLDTAVYSHGHIDHVFGVPVFEEEAAEKGWEPPTVVAHEALPHRFDRYVMTAGWNTVVNQRQFQLPELRWPTEYRYPDATYRDHHVLEVGGVRAELHHARGETDDHTYTWFPDKRLLCCGDLFIWVSPNAGNPQKVQRYPLEWAQACRAMADLGAEVMLPGHGWPVVGAERVHEALTTTAEMLESLHQQAVDLMNAGARLDDLVHTVRVPAHLADRPWLQPLYDEPEFVVRSVWRLYGGWWDGNPASLKPAPEAALAAELAALAGGAGVLAERAVALASSGSDADLRLAGHLAELAVQAAPGDAGLHRARAEVFRRRVAAATSTMAKGVFAWAAKESSEVAGEGS